MNDLLNVGQMTIGTLAERTGLSVSAIRYYEEIGLISKAQRRPSGHRVYGQDAQDVLVLVRSCRAFGFTIEQVRALVVLSTNTQLLCDETREIAQTHLDAVKTKLTELRQLERNLTQLIGTCSESCIGGPAPECNILLDIGTARHPTSAAPGCC